MQIDYFRRREISRVYKTKVEVEKVNSYSTLDCLEVREQDAHGKLSFRECILSNSTLLYWSTFALKQLTQWLH